MLGAVTHTSPLLPREKLTKNTPEELLGVFHGFDPGREGLKGAIGLGLANPDYTNETPTITGFVDIDCDEQSGHQARSRRATGERNAPSGPIGLSHPAVTRSP